jgi:hypothetical protein
MQAAGVIFFFGPYIEVNMKLQTINRTNLQRTQTNGFLTMTCRILRFF